MSATFLAAVHVRRLDAGAVGPESTGDAELSEYIFALDDGTEELWSDVWVNCFAAYGDAHACALPPPPTSASWFPCDNGGYKVESRTDEALRALQEENVELVRDLFATPKDLLRWRSGHFCCGNVVGFEFHLSALHIAWLKSWP